MCSSAQRRVREVEDIDALINAAGGSACVVGTSSGAALALEAACDLAITKLALYEPPFIVDDRRPPLPAGHVTQLAELVSAGRPGDALELYMTRAFGAAAEVVVQMRIAPDRPAMEAVAHTLVYEFTILGETMSGSSLRASSAWVECFPRADNSLQALESRDDHLASGCVCATASWS